MKSTYIKPKLGRLGMTIISEIIFLGCVVVFIVVALFSISAIVKKGAQVSAPPYRCETRECPQPPLKELSIEEIEGICLEVAHRRAVEELYEKI